MKVLVTGGGGFLGRAVCRQLLARGDQVVAYQRSAAPALAAAGAEVVQGDLLDTGALSRAAEPCDAVIHTAAKAGIWGADEDYRRINVDGTQHVIDVCRAHGIRALVHTSSPSVVHDGEDLEDANEFLPYPDHFTAAYPRTKAEAERRVLAASGDALKTVALRPHLIWGPGDPHLLPRLLERAERGVLRLPGADKRIDTTYVDNAALAHVLALDTLVTAPERCAGKAYFISNDQPLTQREIIGALLAAAGRKVEIRSIPGWVAVVAGTLVEKAWRWRGREDEPPLTRFAAEQLATAHWFDLAGARGDLGYRPQVSIREGLARLAAALRARETRNGVPAQPAGSPAQS